jgi:hypothetical protein
MIIIIVIIRWSTVVSFVQPDVLMTVYTITFIFINVEYKSETENDTDSNHIIVN